MTVYEIAVLHRCLEGIIQDAPSPKVFGLWRLDLDDIVGEVWARTEGNVPDDVRRSLCLKLEQQ
jgi:hypothetical protein